MGSVACFLPLIDPCDIPVEFPSPFSGVPHSLTHQASGELQHLLSKPEGWHHDFNSPDGGKMFGVLVVRDNDGRVGYLSAFSGMLAGQWSLPGFVPPVFNIAEREEFLPEGESSIEGLTYDISLLENSAERQGLLTQYEQLLQDREAALNGLKLLHQDRRLLRHNQRERLLLDETLVDNGGHENTLIRLSFESQQDRREQRALCREWNQRIGSIGERLVELDSVITALKRQRSQLSHKLHKKVFSTYVLSNASGEKRQMSGFFVNAKLPGGAGDCAAPKLLHYAHQHSLLPLAMAEFWWGASPAGGIRHHGHYYPACRGKCGPILPFMLEGLRVQSLSLWGADFHDTDAPPVIYEDDDLLVVNKPSGLLSVPGKEVRDSVLTRLQKRYPDASGPLLVHRLDMATSGLLLVAKSSAIHKALQRQFLQRTIEKRYVAVLDGVLHSASMNAGVVSLPLRVDVDDRPRQLVCFEHGKAASTRWEFISCKEDKTRVYFYPLTGRTHQLRIHASHRDGLNVPIVGDELYGAKAERLLLHAERLSFCHPATGVRIELEATVPF